MPMADPAAAAPPNNAASAGIVLAHHWLVGMRGGERVLEELCGLYPDAPIYTMVARVSHLSAQLRSHRIITSPLQFIPGAGRSYKNLLPFFPIAIKAMRIAKGTRLVFSTDASLVKGLPIPEGVPHICYCHSPPRYLWDLTETYMNQTSGLGGLGKFVFNAVIPRLRRFDKAAAERVTHFIANSRFVQRRIQDFYGRDSVVVHPPVDVDAFRPDQPREDFYLLVSELTSYKRVDLAVKAFALLKDKRLVVIGSGSELRSLRASAPPNVTFLGRQSFAALKQHYETCRAFLYPQIEDFGITAVEAQAAGSPVIAFRQGGVLDTVEENRSGVFFDEQTPGALAGAIMDFERREERFSPTECRANAERFRPERFREKILALVAEVLT
jgi:glycosyltransferase involved in cell wall biosynthesis